jgi:RNA polymerase sigma-70 factor (ECF subfamily)
MTMAREPVAEVRARPPAGAIRGLSEAALLEALRSGDRRAAEELVARTYELVYRTLCKLSGGDRELAADLTQETFARAWRGLERFDGRSQLTTWLYRIAYNTFLNHVRRPSLVKPLSDPNQPEDAAPLEERFASSAPSPAEETEAADDARRLRRAVLGLPEELRFAVTARFWGELSVSEIARIQAITEPAVRKRLRRAYLALEVELEGSV